MTEQQQVSLSQQACAEIDKWLAKYPADQRRSAVIPALHIVQKENGGWLTKPLIEAVADYLRIPHIAAYEVATFYSQYELDPIGRHKIAVCTNISCMLRGSDDVVDHLQNKLGIKMGETTPDGKVTLREVECLGACVNAPVLQLADTYYEHLTPAKIDEILEGLD